MKRIVCITDSEMFLMTSIERKLQELKHETAHAPARVGGLETEKSRADALLLYVDEDIAAKQELLVYLKDLSQEEDIPLFLMGDEEGLVLAQKTLTEAVVKLVFHRPIDVSDAAKRMDVYIREHDRSQKKKILVIDDSGAMLRSIKGWLGEKYQVILANSGTMGIKYMSQNRPDLILLDYEMPIIDGRQVLEMIRSEMDFASIPVIFLTGKNDKESILKVLELKPQGYLLKTMKPDEIVKAVDDFFEKSKFYA